MQHPQISVLTAIDAFRPIDERAERGAQLTTALIRSRGVHAFARHPACDHVTASGFVLSLDRAQVLLMHHRKLDLWLQPGGHCDGETDVQAVAAREVSEEIGSSLARLVSRRIFDIDVHEIPARGHEPRHFHHDIRFLFEIDPCHPLPGNSESIALRWVALDEIEKLTTRPSVLIVRHAVRW